MSKPGKKRPPVIPGGTAGASPQRPGLPQGREPARNNPRLQADNRWQRTKRYGWDGR